MKSNNAEDERAKVAVLIHGFPEPIYPTMPLYRYFVERGYIVIAPYLFTPKFKLTQKAVNNYIGKELRGRKPDVIAGLSMGGLLAPALARDYPNAKLILLGTGPYIKPHGEAFKLLVEVSKSSAFDWFYRLIETTPTPVYSFLYLLFNRHKLTLTEKAELATHILQNWSAIKGISESEDKEVIDFLTSIDNSTLLHSLKNKTIIFAGDQDTLMPLELSKRLRSLIRNSKLIINRDAIHYTVFNEDNFKDLDKFL